LKWEEIIHLSTVNLIVGFKGKGKSGLAYWLTETIAPSLDLLPVVVNFPRDKQELLPDNFVIKDLDDALLTERALILVDEGTTQLPAGSKLEEFIKGCSSLSRQREQIVLFIFHASRDVGSRIVRGLDAILIKEPSKRQIQQGSKDKWFQALLWKAKAAFKQVPDDHRGWTYVDSEEPEFEGLLGNPLPSFWSEDLSKAWRGIPLGTESVESNEELARFRITGTPQLVEGLRAIEKFESWWSMSQFPNGWTPEDVGVSPGVVLELILADLIRGYDPARNYPGPGHYTTTSLGRKISLDIRS